MTFTVLAVLVFLSGCGVCCVHGAWSRRITINYAKRQQGRHMQAAQSSHLPLKVNMAGVIPPILLQAYY